MTKNDNLHKAKTQKNDEFYTQLSDIEQELKHYKKYFNGKTVLCNCDDPKLSNFYKFFAMKFHEFRLKKLICTCYKNENEEEYTKNQSKTAVALIYEGEGQPYQLPKSNEYKRVKLRGDGDFRSDECLAYLKEADIVVTNPPFSLFREYVALLMRYHKKFLIIGNQNAITYKDFFPFIKENKVWLGASIHSGDREFEVPNSYPLKAQNSRIDDKGRKYIRVKGIRWWTNIDYPQRHEELILYKKYNEEEYPKYDNYDAINIDKTVEIPSDYDGVMGVPITFLDKYSPEQFVLLGIMNTGELNPGIRYENTPHGRPLVNGKELYLRILIKRQK